MCLGWEGREKEDSGRVRLIITQALLIMSEWKDQDATDCEGPESLRHELSDNSESDEGPEKATSSKGPAVTRVGGGKQAPVATAQQELTGETSAPSASLTH